MHLLTASSLLVDVLISFCVFEPQRHFSGNMNFLAFLFLFNLLKSNKFEELLNLDGMGETQINSIKNFFLNKTNQKVLTELMDLLSIKNSIEMKKNGPLKNKIFMLTGKLEGMSRAEAKSLIEQNSGSIISNVTKKLDYLIIGDKPTKRKVDTAKELKIIILTQTDWLKMLNKSS